MEGLEEAEGDCDERLFAETLAAYASRKTLLSSFIANEFGWLDQAFVFDEFMASGVLVVVFESIVSTSKSLTIECLVSLSLVLATGNKVRLPLIQPSSCLILPFTFVISYSYSCITLIAK